jgi:hypothetical protein
MPSAVLKRTVRFPPEADMGLAGLATIPHALDHASNADAIAAFPRQLRLVAYGSAMRQAND